jgi:hypothetical protein
MQMSRLVPEQQIDILVVEDSATQAQFLAQLLATDGYRVRIACNGREGLRAARESAPPLIVSDIAMPEMDGFEMLPADQAGCCAARHPGDPADLPHQPVRRHQGARLRRRQFHPQAIRQHLPAGAHPLHPGQPRAAPQRAGAARHAGQPGRPDPLHHRRTPADFRPLDLDLRGSDPDDRAAQGAAAKHRPLLPIARGAVHDRRSAEPGADRAGGGRAGARTAARFTRRAGRLHQAVRPGRPPAAGRRTRFRRKCANQLGRRVLPLRTPAAARPAGAAATGGVVRTAGAAARLHPAVHRYRHPRRAVPDDDR